MFHSRDGLFSLATSLTSKHFHLDTGTDIVLTAVGNPGDAGNDEDDAEGSDTVVYVDQHEVFS